MSQVTATINYCKGVVAEGQSRAVLPSVITLCCCFWVCLSFFLVSLAGGGGVPHHLPPEDGALLLLLLLPEGVGHLPYSAGGKNAVCCVAAYM